MWLLLLALLTAEPCPPVHGADELLEAGRVVLLGEVHGTRESPAFALALACRAARADLGVVVGLELAPSAQAAVDAFVGSAGSPEDRDGLLAQPLWQSSYQDGRTSRAVVELIDGVRTLRAAGRNVAVTLFDAGGGGGGQARERGMAAHLLRSIEASPQAVHLILTGNLHSRIVRGTARSSDYAPLGSLLREELPPDRIVALDVAHEGGTAWICAPGCGIVDLAPRKAGPRGRIEIDDSTRPSGHHGWYHVGRITASPPASGVHVDERVTAELPPPAPAPATNERVSLPGVDVSSPAVARLQGKWQASQSGTESWTIEFDGLRFSAVVGPDDWYKGVVSMRPGESPAEIDFLIEDCVCGYRGETSAAIYRWERQKLILATPQPGSRRPRLFDEASGQVFDLVRLED